MDPVRNLTNPIYSFMKVHVEPFVKNYPSAFKAFNQESHSEQELEAMHHLLLSSTRSTNKKRYRSGQHLSAKDRYIQLLFKTCFDQHPEALIATTEAQTSSKLYSRLKKVCYIHLPQLIGDFFRLKPVKWGICLTVFFVFWKVANDAFDQVSHVLGSKVVPFMINNTPLQVIRFGNTLADGFDWMMENRLKLAFYGWLIQFISMIILEALPVSEEIRNRISRINPLRILHIRPQTVAGAVWDRVWQLSQNVWQLCTSIHQIFDSIVQKARREYLDTCRPHVYKEWIRAADSLSLS